MSKGSKLVSIGELEFEQDVFYFPVYVVLHCLPELFRSLDRALWRYLNRAFLFVFVFLLSSSFLSHFSLQLKKKKEDRSICNFL